MNVGDLVRCYPRLFHLAEAGSWPAIARHGLLPARHLVATSSLAPGEQDAILAARRPRAVIVDHPELGRVVLRDQTPLRRHILEAVLEDMTAREWLDVLNERVFFWLRPERLGQLLSARRNRGRPHDVLVVDTRSLVAAHGSGIRLSAINSGATLYPGAPLRGRATFQAIEDYPYAEWRRRRGPGSAIAELTVTGGVPDIAGTS